MDWILLRSLVLLEHLAVLIIVLSPQKWTAPQSYQSCSEKSEASWPCVYICHKTVYFGTILMIKTCFGTKLMIKTWSTHFLSLVQFVAIYALWGGDQSGHKFALGGPQLILRAGNNLLVCCLQHTLCLSVANICRSMRLMMRRMPPSSPICLVNLSYLKCLKRLNSRGLKCNAVKMYYIKCSCYSDKFNNYTNCHLNLTKPKS